MHDSYCSCIFCSIRVAIIFRCCGKNFLNKKLRVNSTKLEGKLEYSILLRVRMTFRVKMIFSTGLVPLFFGSRTVWRWMKGADAAGCKSWINLANPIRATPWIGLSLTPNCSTRGRTSLASAILYAKVRMCRGQESLLSIHPLDSMDYDTVEKLPAGIFFPRRLIYPNYFQHVYYCRLMHLVEYPKNNNSTLRGRWNQSLKFQCFFSFSIL